MLPSVYGAAVYQINVLVITLLASFLPSGSVSYLWYADRITELPLGIFAVAIATASLPTLSEHAAKKNTAEFVSTWQHGIRIALLEAIPSAVGIIALATPIVQLLFERGSFTAESTAGTVGALIFFAMGIPFISGVRNTVPAFYAMKDAKTPVKVATIALLANAAVAGVLMHVMAHRGLALAMAVSSAVNWVILLIVLNKKMKGITWGPLLRTTRDALIASAVMAAVIIAARWFIPTPESTWQRLLFLFPTIAAGLATYMGVLRLLSREDYNTFATILHLKRK